MFTANLTRQLSLLIGALALVFVWMLFAVRTAAAEGKVPVRMAVQTTVGPADAPVRSADYTSADRERVKTELVRWRRYYGYYPPSYGYYPAPYYAYYPGPYYAPGPYATYYYPRRAFYRGPVVYYGW